MAPEPETKAAEVVEMLARLEGRLREMQDEVNARLDAIADALQIRHVDDEAQTLAAERIRSGAAERTSDGVDALAQLGIDAR